MNYTVLLKTFIFCILSVLEKTESFKLSFPSNPKFIPPQTFSTSEFKLRSKEFYFHVTVHRDTWPCIVTNFFTIKPNRCTNFSNVFWNETLHISDSSSVHHHELFTVNTAMVYVIQLSSRIRMEFHTDPARKLSTKLYDIYHCWVYSE
jgi:hypothetical protein